MRVIFRNHVVAFLIFSFSTPTLLASGGGDTKEAEVEAAKAAQALEFQITEKYRHQWVRFPDISGRDLRKGEEVTIQPKKGQAVVAFLVASWCLPCQKLAPSMELIRKKFNSPSARIVFVFAQDTYKDAQGFMKTHKIEGEAILADKATLKVFHEPELPSVYMGDRTNWLALRYLKVNRDQLQELSEILAEHTGY